MDKLNWESCRDHILKASEGLEDFVASGPQEQLRAAEVHALVGLAMSNFLIAHNLRSIENAMKLPKPS